MARAYRRGRPSTAPGIELSQHEDVSVVLLGMMRQAQGLRRVLGVATGRSSRPSQAAAALVEAVGHLQETLLAEHDATYGAETHPMVRTRYVTKG